MSKINQRLATMSKSSHLGVKIVAALASCTIAMSVSALGLHRMQEQAWAGPDADKIVATQGHVDSPKAFWENDEQNFRLYSEVFGDIVGPIEKTVTWVGRGYSYGRSVYQYVVDDKPGSAFLGKAGQVNYLAPALPDIGLQEPVWAGMGADRDIPLEKFRDGEFSLDIVGFDGPGRMELFNSSYGGRYNRLLSSHDPSYRSYWITAGTHTHNNTTVTKPGRYEVTYRVTARAKDDGHLIHSTPQTLVWQFGATSPEGSLPNVEEAYKNAQSTAGADPGTPTLALAPHTGRDNDGDQYLTDFTFTTGKEADAGTVVYYIDGYYLGESQVENGRSEYNENLGSLSSKIQAMYIPTAGDTPRWISQPLAFAGTADPLSTTTSAEALMPKQSDDPAPAFDLNEKQLNDYGISIEVSPTGENDELRVIATSNDPHFYGRIIGGLYEPGDEENPRCEITPLALANGRGEGILSGDYCVAGGSYDGNNILRFTVEPHALVQNGGLDHAALTLEKKPFTTKDTATLTGELPHADTEETDEAAPQPGTSNGDPETPNPTQGDQPGDTQNKSACTAEQPCVFEKGHLDVFDVHATTQDSTTQLDLKLREDITGSGVKQDPANVILHVNRYAKTNATQRLDFIGKEAWLLPQTQDERVLWPGWDTNGIRDSAAKQVTIHLDKITAPAEGKISVFTSDLSGQPQPILDSKHLIIEDGDTITTNASHAHFNWVFTEPGVYRMTAHVTSEVDSASITTPSVVYTWIVDDNASLSPEEAMAAIKAADMAGTESDSDAGNAGDTGDTGNTGDDAHTPGTDSSTPADGTPGNGDQAGDGDKTGDQDGNKDSEMNPSPSPEPGSTDEKPSDSDMQPGSPSGSESGEAMDTLPQPQPPVTDDMHKDQPATEDQKQREDLANTGLGDQLILITAFALCLVWAAALMWWFVTRFAAKRSIA